MFGAQMLGLLPPFPWPSIAPTYSDATIAQYFAYYSQKVAPPPLSSAHYLVPEFAAAVQAGFFPSSEAGLRDFLAWRAVDWASVIGQGFFDWFAWRVRYVEAKGLTGAQVIAGYTTALNDLVSKNQMRAGDANAALAALGAIYGQAAGSVTATPTPTTAAPVTVRKVAQLVITRDPAWGAPGDGIHFPTLAWRTIGQEVASRVWRPDIEVSRWTTWKSGMVNRLSSADTSVTFFEDIKDEVDRGVQISDPRASNFWDYPNLLNAVTTPGPGIAPPSTLGIDVLAAPQSTSAAPVTAPVGTVPTTPPTIGTPTPSPTTPPTTGITTPVPVQPPPPTHVPAPPPPEPSAPTGGIPSYALTPESGGDQTRTDMEKKPDVQSIGLGMGVALLGGLGVLMFFARQRRRRR